MGAHAVEVLHAWRICLSQLGRQAGGEKGGASLELTLVIDDEAIKVLAAPLQQLLEAAVAFVCGRRMGHKQTDTESG